MYDVSGCDDVESFRIEQGNNPCPTTCKEPFFGANTLAYCPPENTNASKEPVWLETMKPQCDCPNANPELGGLWPYTLEQSVEDEAKLRFLSTYMLTVEEDDPSYTCYTRLKTKVDEALTLKDELAARRVSATKIQDWDTAIRRMWNLVAETFPDWVECPEENSPIQWPWGFDWACSEGHGGTIVETCVTNNSKELQEDQSCFLHKRLTGCIETAPCTGPDPKKMSKKDICKYDISDCSSTMGAMIQAGESCEISCQSPFTIPVGAPNVTVLACPDDNYIPGFPLLVNTTCELSCPAPNETQGYRDGVWVCADGYYGTAVATCGFVNGSDQPDNCSDTIVLDGCKELLPCLPLRLEGTQSCMYDISDCQNVMPGRYCEIKCREGKATGASSYALCPLGNTEPDTELIYVWPRCEIDKCSVPTTRGGEADVEAYEETVLCGLQCAEGYAGRPSTICQFDNKLFYEEAKCVGITYLIGCAKTVECVTVLESEYDSCKYDLSGCNLGIVDPEYRCDAKCKDPWTGTSTTIECPWDNTEPYITLPFDPPDCNVPCPTPSDFEGYVKVAEGGANGLGVWQCDGNHTGTPEVYCSADLNPELQPPCPISRQYEGCLKLVPCAPPTVDLCRVDTSDCNGVMGGDSCTLRCKSPLWGGQSVEAFCIGNNTNPKQELVLANGHIVTDSALSCSVSECLPPGNNPSYFKNGTHHLDWICSESAFGFATSECIINEYPFPPYCDGFLQLGGCQPLQDCVFPEEGKCRLDIDHCTGAPGEICRGVCKDEFQGFENFTAKCLGNNTKINNPITWIDFPDCKCKDPMTYWPFRIPDGYQKVIRTSQESQELTKYPDDDEWECAVNYTGIAIVTCQCNGRLLFTGCRKIVPCAGPDPDYFANSSSCLRVEAGAECQAPCVNYRCIAGGPLTFKCPDKNTDPNFPIPLESGVCVVMCEVCSVRFPRDTDPTEGNLSGFLTFGPASANSIVFLPEVVAFRVALEDDCGEERAFLGEVPVSPYDAQCCRQDYYNLTIEQVAIPEGATRIGVKVMTDFGYPQSSILPFSNSIPFRDAKSDDSGLSKTSDAQRLTTHCAVGALIFAGALTRIWLMWRP
jgi:hypothetical protein